MIILYSIFPGSSSPKSISSIEKNTFDPNGETNERCDGISSCYSANFFYGCSL